MAGAPRIVASGVVVWLTALVAVLALVAAAVGLFWTGGPGTEVVTTVRGETAQVYGEGLYQYDSVFKAAGHRGTDAATLILGIPILLVALFSYWRGSVRGAFLLVGMLSYFVYVYASLALGAAYNPLFLVYVALFSAGFFGLVALLKSLWALAPRFSDHLPRRGIAAFMWASGVVTVVVWIVPLAGALLEGEPPALLDHYTTMVTEALDVGIIVPAVFVIAGQTAFQVSAGIELTPPEIIGPVGGFLVLGALAVWIVALLLRDAAEGSNGGGVAVAGGTVSR